MGSGIRMGNAEEFVIRYETRIRALITKHWGPDKVTNIVFVEWPMEDGVAVKITVSGVEFTLPLMAGEDDIRGYWHLIDIEPTESMKKWLNDDEY